MARHDRISKRPEGPHHGVHIQSRRCPSVVGTELSKLHTCLLGYSHATFVERHCAETMVGRCVRHILYKPIGPRHYNLIGLSYGFFFFPFLGPTCSAEVLVINRGGLIRAFEKSRVLVGRQRPTAILHCFPGHFRLRSALCSGRHR